MNNVINLKLSKMAVCISRQRGGKGCVIMSVRGDESFVDLGSYCTEDELKAMLGLLIDTLRGIRNEHHTNTGR